MSQSGMFYHEEVGAPIRVAQALGLTASAVLCGHIASASYLVLPSIMQSPAPLLAKQWKTMWVNDRNVGPAITAFSALVFGYLAYREPTETSTFKLYTAAAVLMPSVIPYTLLLVKPINDKLLKKAETLATVSITDDAASETGVSKDETVHGLVDRWGTLNLGRALLAAAGCLCATWAAIDKLEVVRFHASDIAFKSGANRMG
ncbi:hypothetical protein B0A49_08161 [Cryomyces minteri]|uniref:DUF1772 domain-containing protein n=1 Tax=Cryomyces minteri TaxID=331657 RepID=A0A4V5NFU7_9PEZI|nr:hypothetical protein B0A49_08161 [Cryomyces minteri]